MELVDLLGHLARCSARIGNLDAAIAYYSQAINLLEPSGDISDRIETLLHRGVLYRLTSVSDSAEGDFKMAMELALKVGNREAESIALSNLGLVLRDSGDLAGARRSLEAAFELGSGLSRPQDQITILRNLAELSVIEGNIVEADGFLSRAQKLQNELGPPSPLLLADLGRSQVLAANYHQALDYYFEALWNGETLNATEKARLFGLLGQVLVRLGRVEEARQSYLEALSLLRTHGFQVGEVIILADLCQLSVDHPEQATKLPDTVCSQAVDSARKSGNPGLESESLFQEARSLQSQGRLHDALRAGYQAAELADNLWSNLKGRSRRDLFLTSRADNFRLLADLEMQAHVAFPDEGHDRKALEASERLRARTLIEILSSAGVDFFESADPMLRFQLQSRLTELYELQRQKQHLVGKFSRAQNLDSQIGEILDILDSLHQKIRQASPEFRMLLDRPQVDLAYIQKLLGADTAVAELLLSEPHSHLWVIDKNGLHSFSLPSGKLLEATAARFLNLLNNPGALGNRAAFASMGRQLSSLIWGDQNERLTQLPSRIVFIGDGHLQNFPLSALPLRGTNTPDLHYLVENFEVVHLPSLALLDPKFFLRPERPKRPVILIADPIYKIDTLNATSLSPISSEEIKQLFPARQPDLKLGRLPFANTEADRIVALFGTRPIRVAERLDATKQLLLSSEIKNFGIIHLAAHATSDSKHDELSSILFSEVDHSGKSIDGRLRVQDLFRARLNAELVIASACQTGVGERSNLEGVGGLAQGFFHAGARRTLVSLWEVESESTALLMEEFYRSLLAGDPPGAALRTATLRLMGNAKLNRKPWDSPFYWASFILIGDWRRFPLPASRPGTNGDSGPSRGD